jgi:hypothetical protein
MKLELKMVLTFVFMAFVALSFHTVNTEIVSDQETLGMDSAPHGKDLGFKVVRN